MAAEKTRLRFAGAFFLTAFLAYGFGAGLVAGILEAMNPAGALAAKRVEFFTGASLMLLNSVIVAAIGWLLKPVIAQYSRAVSRVYLLTRFAEAALLAAGVIAIIYFMTVQEPTPPFAMMKARRANFFAYQIGMAVLGFGSLFFCALMHRARLIPRFAAVWGFCGYAIFLSGALLELAGVNSGLLLSIPGGLFELFFGVWLMVKGFRTA